VSIEHRLLFGPLAGVLLVLGTGALALMVPGYSHVQQTVSEIGELGSPARVPFAVMLCSVAACLLLFAHAVGEVSIIAGRSRITAWLLGAMAVSVAGVGVFAHPHALHNVFGISELIGYQTPLAFALVWRHERRTRTLVVISWFMYLVVLLAIALNLSSLDRQGALWLWAEPRYGLVQRSLFVVWFGWCAIVGVSLSRPGWNQVSIAPERGDSLIH
jgi:hypothetical membrane protein